MKIQMQGCKQTLMQVPGYSHLESLVAAIEISIEQNPPLVFDLSRSLIESVCKTILKDRGHSDIDDIGMNDLFKNTYNLINLLPSRVEQNEETITNFKNILDQFDSIIESISKVRHKEGISSHGKDGCFESLDSIQAAFIAGSTDAIVSFLLMAHFNYRTAKEYRSPQYEDFPIENAYIDSINDSFEISGIEFLPSTILYYCDLSAYLETIEQIKDIANKDDSEEEN